MVDISGSMRGIKIQVAKTAFVILCEALEGLAYIRIVLFTGTYHALNILVKDFHETLKPNKIDKFGCHSREGENIDGVSIKHEANKLEKDDIIIVISDGQPAAQGGYNLEDAIPDIHHVRKKFKVFAFSIDSQGDYLNKMYGNDWILTSSRNQIELGQKMIKFCQIIAREFFR
jgi:cobalamin biosynthesis protein CobT